MHKGKVAETHMMGGLLRNVWKFKPNNYSKIKLWPGSSFRVVAATTYAKVRVSHNPCVRAINLSRYFLKAHFPQRLLLLLVDPYEVLCLN